MLFVVELLYVKKKNKNKIGLDVEISWRYEELVYYYVWILLRYFNYVIVVNFKSMIVVCNNIMNKKNILIERDICEYFNYELFILNVCKCICILIVNEGIV